MIESHPFGLFLPSNADKVIVGSFPCFNGRDYGEWFYCGSGRNDFWILLSETYNCPVKTNLERKHLCEANGIALTDIAQSIERIKMNCSDSNLKIIEFNTVGIEKCLTAGINRIFFTSKFVENHFKRLFPITTLKASVLLSPSPSSNRFIGGLQEYKEMKREGQIKSTFDYKLINYKKILLDDH